MPQEIKSCYRETVEQTFGTLLTVHGLNKDQNGNDIAVGDLQELKEVLEEVLQAVCDEINKDPT